MRLVMLMLRTALVGSSLAVAACGGNGTADSSSSPNAADASVMKAALAGTIAPAAVSSPNGTTIPSAAQIIDSSGNLWTVSGGVVYENGALAGYSNGVALVVYDDNVIYQENSAGSWWSWNGAYWVSISDPLIASPNGTTIPSATQIIDDNGNIWIVSAGVVYENGGLAGYSNGVTLLLYVNNVIYQENSAGGWWAWNGGTWMSAADPEGGSPALTISGSPPSFDIAGQAYSFVPTTADTEAGTLAYSIMNLPPWASFSTVTGAITGAPSSAQAGMYSDIVISVSDGTESASLAAFSIDVTAGTATLSWTAPTQNTDGSPLTNLAGYTIYYGTSPNAMTQTIQLTSPSSTAYVIEDLSPGTYYFAVAAYTTTALEGVQSAVASDTIQ